MTVLHWKDIAGRAAFHAARARKTLADPVPWHGHDFAEIFWIDAGHGLHAINGASFPLPPGSVVLIRPTDRHGLRAAGPGELRLTNIAFPRETLDFLRRRYFSRKRWAFSDGSKYPLSRVVEPSRLRRFNRWADELSGSPREKIHLERFLLNVLSELDVNPSQTAPDDAPDWLARACEAMQYPLHFSKGAAEFLRLCGRSREHASRTAHQHLGMSPTDYVNAIRMGYAQRQLEMGNEGILEIALDCGIGNLSHFYGLFRARTGTTPRKYRLAHRRPL